MGVWACGRVGMRMGVRKRITVKKRKKKEKERKKENSLVWACGHVTDGRVFACGRTWMAVNKQTRKGEIKKEWNGLTAGGGHERVMFEHFEQCSNIAKQDQTVQTVFKQHTTARRAVRTPFEHMETNV